MPFDAVSRKDFLNRESESERLAGLARGQGNVLLEGARGMGKTELLKQTYRTLFWQDEREVIPFYYRFQGASLKSASFARDYIGRFIRQVLSWLDKDPSFSEAMSTPLRRLIDRGPGREQMFLADLFEDFREQAGEEDANAVVLAAVSAPVAVAGRYGKRVVVMLDDFHLALRLYEGSPGDSPGMMSLFEGSMRSHLCPHILTGSPEDALEEIFTDDSFRGRAERMRLAPLPEDAAFSMFSHLCDVAGIKVYDTCRGFMKHLEGNPLYIRNMVRALRRMRRQEVTAKAFWECYAYEVSEGETAFYWSSVLRGSLGGADLRRLGMEVLRRSLESPLEVRDIGRLSRAIGMSEPSLRDVLNALQASGMVRTAGGVRPVEDTVLQDFIRSSHMLEVKGSGPEKVRRRAVERRHVTSENGETSFEMVIPMGYQAELVAARAAEQIFTHLKLKREVIEQLQLAIIEACINAMEHSGSYEKKVFLAFSVRPRRLEVSIESPGRVFDPDFPGQQTAEEKLEAENKRGWGLQLMRKIMDDVRVERVEGRTRVVLVKNITPEEVVQ